MIQHSTGVNGLDYDTLGICASVATLCIWTGFFYWVRLFSSTAFYIQLIASTLIDSFAFLVIFVLLLCMFANAILILDRYSAIYIGSGYGKLVQSQTGN